MEHNEEKQQNNQKLSKHGLMQRIKKNIQAIPVQRIVGYTLLFPPILSVLKDSQYFHEAVPVYYGLMAIAGAYLIKTNNNN
jgi:hypothetical protein